MEQPETKLEYIIENQRLSEVNARLLAALEAIFPGSEVMLDILDDSCAAVVTQARDAIDEARK